MYSFTAKKGNDLMAPDKMPESKAFYLRPSVMRLHPEIENVMTVTIRKRRTVKGIKRP
jgi:hypothetical protein